MNPEVKAMSDEFMEQIKMLSVRCVNLVLERDRALAQVAELKSQLSDVPRGVTSAASQAGTPS